MSSPDYGDVLYRRWEFELDYWANDKGLSEIQAGKSGNAKRAVIVAIVCSEIHFNVFDTPNFWARQDLPSNNTYKRYLKDDAFVRVLNALREQRAAFKRHMGKELSADAVVEIQMESLHAVREHARLMRTSTDETVRQRSASDLLDRNPLTSKASRQKSEITGADGGPVKTEEVGNRPTKEQIKDVLIDTVRQRILERRAKGEA